MRKWNDAFAMFDFSKILSVLQLKAHNCGVALSVFKVDLFRPQAPPNLSFTENRVEKKFKRENSLLKCCWAEGYGL